jgi:hypothetical protein
MKEKGWRYGSLEEHLLGMCKALGLIPRTAKKKKKRESE